METNSIVVVQPTDGSSEVVTALKIAIIIRAEIKELDSAYVQNVEKAT